jgi:hypothetical protein
LNPPGRIFKAFENDLTNLIIFPSSKEENELNIIKKHNRMRIKPVYVMAQPPSSEPKIALLIRILRKTDFLCSSNIML